MWTAAGEGVNHEVRSPNPHTTIGTFWESSIGTRGPRKRHPDRMTEFVVA
jgi:hypothetical protein